MPLTSDQLRAAFADLNGQRGVVRIEFDSGKSCTVKNAILVPVEDDNVLKLTDGAHEFLIDAERVTWIEIG